MASKYSSIPQIVDYLYAKIAAAAAPMVQVVVADGYPGTEEQPDIIAIGGTIAPVVQGGQEPGTLGARNFNEHYEIDVTLSSYRGGSATDQANGEKIARDAAFALYDLVVGVLAADLSLGGLCQWGIPGKLAVAGTNVDTAAAGVIVDLTFSIAVYARISLY